MPHHVRAEEESLYREGAVVERSAGEGRCWVNIGLKSDCLVERSLKPGLRVTVKGGVRLLSYLIKIINNTH